MLSNVSMSSRKLASSSLTSLGRFLPAHFEQIITPHTALSNHFLPHHIQHDSKCIRYSTPTADWLPIPSCCVFLLSRPFLISAVETCRRCHRTAEIDPGPSYCAMACDLPHVRNALFPLRSLGEPFANQYRLRGLGFDPVTQCHVRTVALLILFRGGQYHRPVAR